MRLKLLPTLFLFPPASFPPALLFFPFFLSFSFFQSLSFSLCREAAGSNNVILAVLRRKRNFFPAFLCKLRQPTEILFRWEFLQLVLFSSPSPPFKPQPQPPPMRSYVPLRLRLCPLIQPKSCKRSKRRREGKREGILTLLK